MKILRTNLVALFFTFFIATATQAQIFEITAYGGSRAVFGDFTKQDLNLQSAGYSSYGSGMGFNLQYYLDNNFGIAVRSTAIFYAVDADEYEEDMRAQLGITNEIYDFSNGYAYAAFESELGVSYVFDVANQLQLEPYVYLGFVALASPTSTVEYLQNSITYSYQTKSSFFGGISYAPGLRFKWNFSKHFGLQATQNITATYLWKTTSRA